ncbi:hypothetical protein Pmani_028118 [Petrolisthes manimaculis]|uniref:Nucleoporin p58/p45 n=1 Tax=Petrolisthes manimaculis TaxID=1843537 RepID=A0AAE1TYC6_9EUCA|nr:hypothetical protein Pmani_028118 [Petrolisthes manimaculis]
MANSSSGFSFGQPQPTLGTANNNNNNKSLFGTPTSTGTPGGAFTLNTVTSTSTAQPVVATSATGFTLGAATGGSTVGFGLGQPAVPTAASTGFGLGQPAVPTASSTGFGLGQPAVPTAASTGFGLGQPAVPTAASTGFGLGQPAVPTAASTGFGLGQPAVPTASSTGFGLGQPAVPTAASTGFGLGQPAVPTAASTGFGLGQPAVPTASSTGFGLGQPAAPTTSSTGFNFGATPVLGNSVSALPTNSASTGGGGLFNFSNPAPTSTGFTLGGQTLTAPATAPNVSLGFALTGSAPASTATGFPLGLGGTTATVTPSTGFSFSSGAGGLKVTPVQAPVSSNVGLGGVGLGLGGAQPPSASTDANNAGSKSDGKSTKDQQMPQDLFATIAEFESKRNAEISASEENIRQTAAPFHKVGNKAVEIQKLLAELASEYLQLHGNAVNLKAEVMLAAEHVEMSRRTKDTPMALQGENKAPEMFFINLVRNFESEMIYCRTKIEEVSQCMQAINNPCETPEDIGEVLQREHDTLKELAAKVYAQHAHLVELSQTFKTKTVPNEHAFFRSESKEDAKTPASAVVRPVLGGNSSGLQVFQEQQQRAKAVTLGAAPPTMPLAQATTPSMFSGANTSNLFTSGGTPFGTSNFNLGSSTTTAPFGVHKPAAFGNVATNFGNTTSTFGTNTTGLQQQQSSSPFAITSPFNTKPFGS